MHFIKASLFLSACLASVYAQNNKGDATWYHTGLGSCGNWNAETDYIAALSFPDINDKRNCGRKIVVWYQGRSVEVTAADTCPECAQGSLDLSPAAFEQLAPRSVGRLHGIEWYFNS